MSNIRLTVNNKQDGRTVYTSEILQSIVEIAVMEVEGALPLKGKKNGISIVVDKDSVYVNVSAVVRYGFNVPEIAYRIQQSVKQSVENMTHFKVGEVDVHVVDVVFTPGQPLEREELHEEDGAEEEHAEEEA